MSDHTTFKMFERVKTTSDGANEPVAGIIVSVQASAEAGEISTSYCIRAKGDDPYKTHYYATPDRITSLEWRWWHQGTEDDEGAWGGECLTREAAIENGRVECGEEFDIIEARCHTPRLAAWITDEEIAGLIEKADEAIMEDGPVWENDDTVFHLDDEERASLIASIRRAVEEWQTANTITFSTCQFAETRNKERITPASE